MEQNASITPGASIFTDTEKEILILFKAGHAFKTVAAELQLSPRKVKYIVETLRRRFSCQNTTQLIVMCIERQLI